MKIEIDLHKLKPSETLTQASFKRTTGAQFFKLFQQGTSLGSPTLSFRDLIRFALDSGYGAHRGINQSQFIKISAVDRARLSDYLRGRLFLVRHLLDISPTKRIQKHSVTLHLESSDTADASFLLGTIGCRYATEQWLKANKAKIKRFWHFTLYSAPVVTGSTFTFLALKSGKKRRPDFVVEDSGGNWYAIEAKGTFGRLNKTELLSGMHQASRLKAVQVIANGQPAATKHLIRDYGVTCTYFNKKNELRICLLDPPGDDANSIDRETVSIIDEMAVLLDFFRVTQQFRTLGIPSSERSRRALPTIGGVSWVLLDMDSKSQADPTDAIWIGIVDEVQKNETRIRNVLRVFEIIIPSLRRAYLNLHRANENQSSDLILNIRRNIFEIEYEATTWNTVHAKLARTLLTFKEDDILPPTWTEALAKLFNKKIFSDDRYGTTVRELVERLQQSVRSVEIVQQISGKIYQGNAENRFKIDVIGNGLLIGGGRWDPAPLPLSSRRSKI